MDMMDALDIAQVISVVAMVLVAFYALDRAFELSDRLTTNRKEDDETDMHHVQSADDPRPGD
jgi:Ni/Fe-hydrogenase subunit HybB-like protein